MIQKVFKNEGGDIKVYDSRGDRGACGIVTLMNMKGYVIGAWDVRDNGSGIIAEFRAVHDRLSKEEFSFDIMEAIRYGQQLADVLIKSDV